jgi:hypothetical protein
MMKIGDLPHLEWRQGNAPAALILIHKNWTNICDPEA